MSTNKARSDIHVIAQVLSFHGSRGFTPSPSFTPADTPRAASPSCCVAGVAPTLAAPAASAACAFAASTSSPTLAAAVLAGTHGPYETG